MPELKSEDNILLGIAVILISFASFLMLGTAGLRVILGIVFIMFLPFYLLLHNSSLSQQEKIAFSFFISIALFPSLVYWLGFAVSFRISIIAVFLLLLILPYIISKISKKHGKSLESS